MSFRHSIGLFVALAVVQIPGFSAAQSAAPAAEVSLRTLSVTDVSTRLAHHDNVFVFDNNNRARYETGHVPGARWVAFNAVRAEDLPSDHTATLVFYCANEQCGACHTAARSASALGYANVFIMPQGIMGWVASGQHVVTGPNPT